MDRRRLGLALAGLLAGLGAACGGGDDAGDDDAPGDPDAGTTCEAPVGRPAGSEYDDPEDLEIEGCVAGGLADLDLDPVYLLRGETPGILGQLVRFEAGCDGDLTTTAHGKVRRTDDRIDWSTRTFAGALCRDAEGALIGRVAACYGGDGWEECYPADVVAEPFAALDEPVADGLTLLAEVPRPSDLEEPDALVLDVRVADGIAFVVLRGALMLVDVADPRAPEVRAIVREAEQGWNDVEPFTVGERRYAVVTGKHQIFFDVTDPDEPTEVARLNLGGGHTVTIDGTTAYLASGGMFGTSIYDVSDPAEPLSLGHWTGPTHDLQVIDGMGYVCDGIEGFHRVDFTDPADPQLLGTTANQVYSHAVSVTTAGGRLVAVHGDEGLGSTIRVIDVEPGSETLMDVIGTYELPGGVSVHNVFTDGERAYVAWYQYGLRVLDLADPTAPVEVGHYRTWSPEDTHTEYFEGALGIDRDEAGTLYVADLRRGLLIFAED